MKILLYILAAVTIFLIGIVCGWALLATLAVNYTQREEELEDEAGRD